MTTADGEMALSADELKRVQGLIRALAGITLADSKRGLVVSRLGKRVRAMGAPNVAAYLDRIEAAGGEAERQAFVNALTTNLTRFFREPHHFDRLAEHVGRLVARPAKTADGGRPRLRIWSAGCSSGQEPYSIALTLLRRFPALAGWDFRILATDIDTEVLERGSAGRYPVADIEELGAAQRWGFERAAEGQVVVGEAVRRVVSFRQLNLMDDWPMGGPFDAIFCRNVAIYFDRATQQRLFARLAGMVAPGGLLLLGHSETLGGGVSGLKLIGETAYRKDSAAVRDAA